MDHEKEIIEEIDRILGNTEEYDPANSGFERTRRKRHTGGYSCSTEIGTSTASAPTERANRRMRTAAIRRAKPGQALVADGHPTVDRYCHQHHHLSGPTG